MKEFNKKYLQAKAIVQHLNNGRPFNGSNLFLTFKDEDTHEESTKNNVVLLEEHFPETNDINVEGFFYDSSIGRLYYAVASSLSYMYKVDPKKLISIFEKSDTLINEYFDGSLDMYSVTDRNRQLAFIADVYN